MVATSAISTNTKPPSSPVNTLLVCVSGFGVICLDLHNVFLFVFGLKLFVFFFSLGFSSQFHSHFTNLIFFLFFGINIYFSLLKLIFSSFSRFFLHSYSLGLIFFPCQTFTLFFQTWILLVRTIKTLGNGAQTFWGLWRDFAQKSWVSCQKHHTRNLAPTPCAKCAVPSLKCP